ncbi:MAG: L,D-transpeptidase [Hyphomicrobiales bacterium]|nr:L,D-transpeptidase [Hyphomicrobiales bacterium]
MVRFFKSLTAMTTCLIILVATAGSPAARTVVSYKGIARGAIIIKTSQRRLYLGLGNGKAVKYPVGVGRMSKQWTGQKWIHSKRIKPAWSPTAQILRDKPGITRVIPGGTSKNPMGAAALILSGSGQYAIHGTNNPGSIGRFVSYGCIRMYNADIRDLYSRVRIGTKVTVIK